MKLISYLRENTLRLRYKDQQVYVFVGWRITAVYFENHETASVGGCNISYRKNSDMAVKRCNARYGKNKLIKRKRTSKNKNYGLYNSGSVQDAHLSTRNKI